VYESSDLDPSELSAHSRTVVHALRAQGFSKFEEAGAYEERMSEFGDPSLFNPRRRELKKAT